MDNKELLKKVVLGLINEDDAGASEAFKEYAINKSREIIESKMVKSKAETKEEDGEEETEAVIKDVSNKVNADD